MLRRHFLTTVAGVGGTIITGLKISPSLAQTVELSPSSYTPYGVLNHPFFGKYLNHNVAQIIRNQECYLSIYYERACEYYKAFNPHEKLINYMRNTSMSELRWFKRLNYDGIKEFLMPNMANKLHITYAFTHSATYLFAPKDKKPVVLQYDRPARDIRNITVTDDEIAGRYPSNVLIKGDLII